MFEDTSEMVGYTVFAPTNAALAGVSDAFSSAEVSKDLLLHYMAAEVYHSFTLPTDTDLSIVSMQGSELTLRVNNGGGTMTVSSPGSTATTAAMDKLAYNGLVHAINATHRQDSKSYASPQLRDTQTKNMGSTSQVDGVRCRVPRYFWIRKCN